MSEHSLTKTRIHAGVYEAVLNGPDAGIIATHLGQEIEALSITQAKQGWDVRLHIPQEILNDGVQTIMLCNKAGVILDSFTIITGEPLANDLRGEIDLLRAELDMLKKAFRRHVAGTGD